MATKKNFATRWFDESWRGREAELVTIAEIAKIARVDRTTVNGWIRRYDHFPKPVKEEIAGPGPTRYFVAAAVTDWLDAQNETRWFDESWRGREAELVTIAEIAKIARVDPTTVNGWIRRYDHFPKPVKEVATRPLPTRFFVTGAVVHWIMSHRNRGAALDESAADLDREISHLVSIRDHIRGAISDTRE